MFQFRSHSMGVVLLCLIGILLACCGLHRTEAASGPQFLAAAQASPSPQPAVVTPTMTGELAVIQQPNAFFSGGFSDSQGRLYFTLGDSSYLYVADLLGTDLRAWYLANNTDPKNRPHALNSKLMGGTVAGNKAYMVFARNDVTGPSSILAVDLTSTISITKHYPLGEVVINQVLASPSGLLYISLQDKGDKYASSIVRFDTTNQALHRVVLPITGGKLALTEDNQMLLVVGPLSNHTTCLSKGLQPTCSMQFTLDAKWLSILWSNIDFHVSCAVSAVAMKSGTVYLSGLMGTECFSETAICTFLSPEWTCNAYSEAESEGQEWAFFSPDSFLRVLNFQSGMLKLTEKLDVLGSYTMSTGVVPSAWAFPMNIPNYGPGLVIPAVAARDGGLDLYQFSWELFI